MNLEIKFKKNQEISNFEDIVSLLENAFPDLFFAQSIKSSFFNGYNSNYPNFVLIEKENKPLAVAVVGLRKIRLFDSFSTALTIGPVAVAKNMQKKGLGRMLMEGVENLAQTLSADLLYLVGIQGFYKNLGFKTFMKRSKIVIDSSELPNIQASFESYDSRYKNNLINCYRDLSSRFNYSALRTDEIWDWLLNHATNSYYFYKPQIVLDKLNNFVGYFTYDPNNPSRLRESAYINQVSTIETFLSGLRAYACTFEIKKIELMTPKNSPLYSFCKKYLNFSFVELYNVDAGQMIKQLSEVIIKDSEDNNHNPSFIFQGDNF